MLTVALDIDDVVCDLLSEWLRFYNLDYDDTLEPKDITAWNLVPFVKQSCGEKIYDYLYQPQLYNLVKPHENALESVYKIRSFGHKVIFVTATPETTRGRKLQWLNDNGFKVSSKEYIETSEKYLIRADILLDDRPDNVQDFVGNGILFRRAHNKYFNWGNCIKTWKEFVEIIRNY